MSGLLAFFRGKCPQCRKGNVFTHTVWNLKRFRDMNEHCPSCQVKFESEPGFFWGAMYFSYAYTVAFLIIIGFFYFSYFEEYSLGWYIGAIIGFSLLTAPASFRMSRLLMMYLAAPYRKYQGNYKGTR
ncbi:MAG: DUF983 domain-containing protein [Bacteroidia bacterium]|nr:DUF983 domain-containing protein [Bacteroidia bacterium]